MSKKKYLNVQSVWVHKANNIFKCLALSCLRIKKQENQNLFYNDQKVKPPAYEPRIIAPVLCNGIWDSTLRFDLVLHGRGAGQNGYLDDFLFTSSTVEEILSSRLEYCIMYIVHNTLFLINMKQKLKMF